MLAPIPQNGASANKRPAHQRRQAGIRLHMSQVKGDMVMGQKLAVVVTGGAGKQGGAVVKSLIERGHARDFRGTAIGDGEKPALESPMELQGQGVRKYPPTSALLASSAGLGWSTISVELRSHGVSEAPAIVPQHVEICLVVAGNKDGLVRRTGAGFRQEATPKTGAIWLSPAGVGKEIVITAPIPQTMHLYLPTTLFDRLKDDFNQPVGPAHSIRHAVGISDDVIDQIGRSMLSELVAESAASRLYLEAASLTLAARLLQKHCDSTAGATVGSSVH